ncbi:hypothetical protein [Streptomyces sp. NPDC059018]|uniref:hypothetical protein n=1 Tax=Streptomyces sp. NPDC059018 TaxID=3346701 RepID=UPI00368430D8
MTRICGLPPLGTFLRAFTWGHGRQLESTARMFTANLVRHCALLPGADHVIFLDIDSKVRSVATPSRARPSAAPVSVACTSRS